MAKGYQLQNVYLICSLATLGGMMQSFDVSGMSAIIATKQYKTFFNHPGSTLAGGITASMAGGSLLGSIATNLTGDRFGRRDSVAIGCVIFMIGSAIMSSVQNVPQLILALVINGFAVGIFSCQAPLYSAEISKPNCRGRFIALQNWMIACGTLIIYYISYGCSFVDSSASFRIPWGVQMFPAVILIIAIPFLPRSPRWLASKDRWEEAHNVLAALHAKGNRLEPLVLAELQDIKEKIFLERSYNSTSWTELTKRRNISSGNNALQYYIVYIFSMAGLSGNKSLIAVSIQYCISVGVQVMVFLLADQYRRRWAFTSGSTLQFNWLFAAAGLMATYGHAVPGGLDKAIIACTYLFVASYALTWGLMGWIYPAEVLPLYKRSKATSIGVATNWVGNFALTFFTPPAFQNIQWRTFIIFGCFNVTSLIHSFLLFPESKQKTLEEMDEVFVQDLWAFRHRSTESRLTEEMQQAQKDIEGTAAEIEALERQNMTLKA